MTEDQGADEDQGGADSGPDQAQEADGADELPGATESGPDQAQEADEADEDQGASLASVRAQAQDLRDRLAGEMDAPAQQDEQAARRRATAEEGHEGTSGEVSDDSMGTEESDPTEPPAGRDDTEE